MHSNLLGYLSVGAIPSVTKSMVKERPLLLLCRARHTGDVQYGNHLGEGTGDTIGGREFAYTEGRGDDSEGVGLDTGVPIGCVRGVEFVAVSDPVDIRVVLDQVLPLRLVMHS